MRGSGPVGAGEGGAGVLASGASRRPSSTGRTPPACCRSRSGRTTRSGGARSGPGACAGTRAIRTSASGAREDPAEGPLTATELGGAKNGGPWWDWSETKIAVEWLLDTGDVICVRRAGWRRVYDLPERVLPAELLAPSPTDAECAARLAEVAARALGVVTEADLSDYHRINYGGAEMRREGDCPPVTAALAPRRPGWCRSR